MKKQILIPIIIAIAIVSFFGGITYSKLTTPKNNLSGFTQRGAGNFTGGRGQMGVPGQNSNQSMLRGEVVSADSSSITVKTESNGSKIVMFSDKTEIMETAVSDIKSLIKGKSIIVTGEANTDGTVTAKIISLRAGNTTTAPANSEASAAKK